MAEEVKVRAGYVRWSDNVKLIITVFCITVAISLGAINLHSQAPHKDAVNKREFDRLSKTVDSGFERINDKLDHIVDRLPKR